MEREIKYLGLFLCTIWLSSCADIENNLPNAKLKNSPIEYSDKASPHDELVVPSNDLVTLEDINKDDEPFILILKENTAQDEALASGWFSIEMNCLIYNTMGRKVTPVFQPAHNIKWISETNQISYYGGTLQLGERVSITGGFVKYVEKSYNLLELYNGPIPEYCPVEGYHAGRIGGNEK